MKKLLALSLLSLLLPVFSFAQRPVFSAQNIPKKHPYLTGTIPVIQGTAFQKINHQIQQDLLQETSIPIEFNSQKLLQNSQYLSIQVFKTIAGGRTYYRDVYYVIDIPKQEFLSLHALLKQQNLSASAMNKQIRQQLDRCFLAKNRPEFCDGVELENLLATYQNEPQRIDVKSTDGFYIKPDIVGISFDLGYFSYPFEFDLKTQQLK